MAESKIKKPTIEEIERLGTAEGDCPSGKFVLYEKVVDKHNTKRVRVCLTPAVCDECGLDLCVVNADQLDDRAYHQLRKNEQEEIREAVAAHKTIVHRKETQRVIDEEDIPAGWLGKKRGGVLQRDVK